MKINNDQYMSANINLSAKTDSSANSDFSKLFSSVLSENKQNTFQSSLIENSNSSKSPQDLYEICKKKGFKGFFKAIEEEKVKKLREEILLEMGLTQEKLAQMPPDQVAAIEKLVSEEIQRRMAIGSMKNKEEKNLSFAGNTNQNIGQPNQSAPFLAVDPLLNLTDIKSAENSDQKEKDKF